jgi:hypothetical protein
MSASFAEQIRSFGDGAKRKQTDVLRKASLDIFSRIIMRTPVDTGRLRGNWQATLERPATGEVDLRDNSPVNDTGAGGGAAIGAMTMTVLGAESPTLFYLSNTLPYAARIEYEGHSRVQAPQGMVRRTLVEFQSIVEDAVR